MRKTKLTVWAFMSLLALSLWANCAIAKTIYMGPKETYTTLKSAFAAMAGGDTLIIREGTYSGSDNNITQSQKPPSGSEGNYTTIQGTAPGAVKFTSQMSTDYSSESMSYVIFKNIEWIGANGPLIVGVSSANRSVHHVKFQACGSNDQFSTMNSQYILFEDCYVTGNSNYPFITYDSDHNIFRRCVARMDATAGVMPMSHFMSYGSQYVEFQNCIAIDSNSQYYTNSNASLLGGFYIRETHAETGNSSIYNNVRGSIVLNVKHRSKYEGFVHSVGNGATGFHMENTIFWDMDNGYVPNNGGISGATYDHNTYGISTHRSTWPWNSSFAGGQSGYGIMTNCIAYRAGDYAFYQVQSYDYCSFYANGAGNVYSGSNGGHNITNIDPLNAGGLKYLVRTESNGSLHGAGSNGTDIGATILYKIGTDGALYGETGYASTTTNPLWPWPNEGVIKTFFINESPATSPSPTRGFTSGTSKDGSPETLTKYIWEYLGNTIPPEIYAGTAGTLSPPPNFRATSY
jgi:hypothetical protein